MRCEASFTTLRFIDAAGSSNLISFLDPTVEITYPPAGVKDLCIFSLCRRAPDKTSEIWHFTASSPEEALYWVNAMRAPRPKLATPSCLHHMRIQRFLSHSDGALTSKPFDSLVKSGRNYWAAADRFAGATPHFISLLCHRSHFTHKASQAPC
jgi:hypothetical protein